MFKLYIKNKYWLDKNLLNKEDLCLHGDLEIQLDEKNFYLDDITISGAAFSLLRSLDENHYRGQGLQVFPHCGNSFILDAGQLEILGCDRGLDFNIIHRYKHIELSSDHFRALLDFRDYEAQVLNFAREVLDFYDQYPRELDPEDENYQGFLHFIRMLRYGTNKTTRIF